MKQAPELVQRIRSRFIELSDGERRIASYILDNYKEAAFMTAARLGEKVGVSGSTVVRFAFALGYSGYPDLQKALQEMVKSRLTTVDRLRRSVEDLGENGSLLPRVMRRDIDNIRHTLDELSIDTFERCIDAILEAEKVIVIGFRSAAPLASFLGNSLHLILKNVVTITSGGSDIFDNLISLSERDLVIGISFPRYTRQLIDVVEYARSKGCRVMALTSNHLSPLSRQSDLVLTAKTDLFSFVDSYVAPLSIINALITGVALEEEEQALSTLAELEKVWDKYEIFFDTEE